MTRVIVILLLVFKTASLKAQQIRDEEQVKEVIETFFKALHTGDSALMKSTFHKDIKIQTTGVNKNRKDFLKTINPKELLKNVALKKIENTYFEKLLSIDIKTDLNLASVWIPYEFYFNNKLSHCGANSFQLFFYKGEWKIIFLVDSRRINKCNKLINK